MLVIHDDQIARQLQQIAEKEQRPVEDVLKSMIAQYPTGADSENIRPEKSEAVKRVRRKAYAKARQYWQSVGDTTKAALTDDELDEQFGRFDEEGIPRLKSELKSLEPPPGSLSYAAKIAANSQFRSGRPDLASRAEEILDEHFAEDYLKRMRDEDGTE
jgi:hypothetical protein